MRCEALTSWMPVWKEHPFREIDLTYLAVGIILGLVATLGTAAFLTPTFTAQTVALMGVGAACGGALSLVIQKIAFHYLHPTKKFREVPLPRFKSPAMEEIKQILQKNFESKDWYQTWKRDVHPKDHLNFLKETLAGGTCFGICVVLALHLSESRKLTSKEALRGFFTKYREDIICRQLLEIFTVELESHQKTFATRAASSEQYKGLTRVKKDAGIVIFDNGKVAHVLFYDGNRMLDVWSENTGFYRFEDFEAGLKLHLMSYGELVNIEYRSPA